MTLDDQPFANPYLVDGEKTSGVLLLKKTVIKVRWWVFILWNRFTTPLGGEPQGGVIV